MSVFGYFTSELTRGYHLEVEEDKYTQKRQRVYIFLKTPHELERFASYGFFQCLDAFLFVFTFLPMRILLAVLKILTAPCGIMRSRKFLEPAQICDILKGIILIVCTFIMSYIDTSMMYHIVRGQATIKLYVFFNMLDMADRVLSNLGHDILDALFWTTTEPRGRKREHLGTLPHLFIAIIYVIAHTLLILFQATVLNVAFNSHNKSLLVIMMSNNFVEIKSNLFKKVDINHLYQISCSDMKERFHYVILLAVVCVRNMNEVAWDIEHLAVLLPDAVMVLISEIVVDWGKHAFIVKFNEIPADVYREFKVKLALDMATSRQSQAFTDHSDLVSRRMGLTPLPLACLLLRILKKSVSLTCLMDYCILLAVYLCLMSFKVLISIILLGHSYKVIQKYHEENQSEKSANQDKDHSKSTNEDKDKSKSTNQDKGQSKLSNQGKGDSKSLTNQNIGSADVSPPSPGINNDVIGSSFDRQMDSSSDPVLCTNSYSEVSQLPFNLSAVPTGLVAMETDQNPLESQLSSQEIDQSCEHPSINTLIDDPSLSRSVVPHPTDRAVLSATSTDNEPLTYNQANQSVDTSSSVDTTLPDCGEATVFQKSSRSVLMSFSVGKSSLSSSASVPENIGHMDTNNGNDDQSMINKRLKTD
ncbi:Transmembrane anterior posterior transformation protein 1 [Mactra antiquata]